MTGNTSDPNGQSLYRAFLQRVFLMPIAGYQNDVIAHELGHHIDYIRSGDTRFATNEQQEVAEGIADMFAYDFDREDATLGEDSSSGKNTEAPIRNWATSILGQPFRMADYRCNAGIHFNSTILSHAYYSFVQDIGPDVAGFLLYQLPHELGPNGTFVGLANAFVHLATTNYPNNPEVAADARQAFLIDGGLTQGPPACPTAAPPPPPPPALPPPPPPLPPWNVAVPDLLGDTPGAASSELSAVGLTIGTQRSVVDNTCNNIGAVLSQTPSAGTQVAPGTAVDLSIGRQPPTPCP